MTDSLRPQLMHVVVFLLGSHFVMLYLSTSNSLSTLRNTKSVVSPKSAISSRKRSNLFPERLVSIFGLEKSGTTWTATTIAKAFGILDEEAPTFSYNVRSSDETVEIQHISQPWGFFPPSAINDACRPDNVRKTKDIFAAVPEACAEHKFLFRRSADAVLPTECIEEAGLEDFVHFPSRFFVNVTSHILWYLEHGVDATAVILMRDNTIAHASKTSSICRDANVSRAQNEHANLLTRQAISGLPPERVVLVSFEGLVSLGMPYLLDIFRQLGIENTTHRPTFKDANRKYINTKV